MQHWRSGPHAEIVAPSTHPGKVVSCGYDPYSSNLMHVDSDTYLLREEPVNPPFTTLAAKMAALLTAAAVPAQPVGPGRPADATNAALIPDFSGIWARISFPGFEPPLSGPGPVTNRLRGPNSAGSVYGAVGYYNNPILKPQAAEIVKRHREIELSAPNSRTQCWLGGVPFVFTNVGMQMLQQPASSGAPQGA